MLRIFIYFLKYFFKTDSVFDFRTFFKAFKVKICYTVPLIVSYFTKKKTWSRMKLGQILPLVDEISVIKSASDL